MPTSITSHNLHENRGVALAHIGRGTGIIFLGRILERGLRYVYAIILAKTLGAELFGTFLLGLTVISLAGIISRLGFDSGVVRYIAVYSGTGDKQRVKGVIALSIISSVIVSVLVAAVLFVTAEYLSVRIFRKPQLEGIIKLLSISLPFLSAAIVALACTQGFHVMKYIVYGRNLLLPLSNIVLVVLLSLAGLGLMGVGIAHVASALLACACSICFVLKASPHMTNTKTCWESGPLLRFSVPLLLVSFLNFLIIWTDTLMLGYFRTSPEVGVYSAAMRTALLIGIVLASLNAVFAPMVSQMYHTKKFRELEDIFKTVTMWAFTVSFPIFLLMVLLSKEIMGIFGQAFVVGCIPFVILGFAQVVNAAAGPVGVIITMSGRQDIMMIDTLGVCLLNILLNWLLIPAHGMTGAAVASAASLIVFNIVMLVESFILYGVHPYKRQFLNPAFVAAAAFAAALGISRLLEDLHPAPKVGACIAVFAFVFAALLWKIGLSDSDKTLIGIFRAKLAGSSTRNAPQSNSTDFAKVPPVEYQEGA